MDENQQNEAKRKRDEIVKREMRRRANDTIRVRNPTGEDYYETWDGHRFFVPASDNDTGFGEGQALLPRYIAMNYVKNMSEKRAHAHADEVIAEENEKRKDQGRPALTPQEREEMETPMRTDNEAFMRQFVQDLWMGVEREYGHDDVSVEEEPAPRDTRPLTERLIEEMEGGSALPVDDEPSSETSELDEALEEIQE